MVSFVFLFNVWDRYHYIIAFLWVGEINLCEAVGGPSEEAL